MSALQDDIRRVLVGLREIEREFEKSNPDLENIKSVSKATIDTMWTVHQEVETVFDVLACGKGK